jgi:hypothetical protein
MLRPGPGDLYREPHRDPPFPGGDFLHSWEELSVVARRDRRWWMSFRIVRTGKWRAMPQDAAIKEIRALGSIDRLGFFYNGEKVHISEVFDPGEIIVIRDGRELMIVGAEIVEYLNLWFIHCCWEHVPRAERGT